MPEVQKPVLEHAAPKAIQNQGLDGQLTSTTIPQSKQIVKSITPEAKGPRWYFLVQWPKPGEKPVTLKESGPHYDDYIPEWSRFANGSRKVECLPSAPPTTLRK